MLHYEETSLPPPLAALGLSHSLCQRAAGHAATKSPRSGEAPKSCSTIPSAFGSGTDRRLLRRSPLTWKHSSCWCRITLFLIVSGSCSQGTIPAEDTLFHVYDVVSSTAAAEIPGVVDVGSDAEIHAKITADGYVVCWQRDCPNVHRPVSDGLRWREGGRRTAARPDLCDDKAKK